MINNLYVIWLIDFWGWINTDLIYISKFMNKIIQKTKALQLAWEIRNQVQLAGLILCLVYLKANTYILC